MRSIKSRSVLSSGVTVLCVLFLFLITPAVLCAQGLRAEDVYREIGYVPMEDGVKLAYVVYRPNKQGRFPVIVKYDAYDTNGMSPAKHDYILDFVNHGYAMVGANVRGSGCSEGSTFTIMDPQQAKDGAALIEWIGSQPWSDGNVGMFGNSYSGHTQIFVAAERPKYLKALAAGGLTADLYREAFRPGGMFNVSFAAFWGFHAQPGIAKQGADSRLEMGDSACLAHRAQQPPNQTFYDVENHPLDDQYWKDRATENRVDLLNIPMLIVQGWQDQQTAMGGPRLFQRLKGPKRMILQNGGHGVYYTTRAEVIRWMDRWLKGEQNGIEKEPPVTVWFESRLVDKEPKPAWVQTFADWPVPEAQWLTLYLTADGRLIRNQPAADERGTRTYIFPVGTELVGNNVMFANPPSPLGSLAYRTAPVAEDTVILGSAQFTFYVSTEKNDTDFMVVLHDISPSGETLFLQRGLLRASHRAVDPMQSSPHWVFHPHDKPEKLNPGEVYEIKLSLPAVGHVLRRGHSLELVIMAPSATPAPNWGPMPLDLPGVNTVHHSLDYPSRLMIPVVPELKAQAPAPKCGALGEGLYQPCRPPAPK